MMSAPAASRRLGLRDVLVDVAGGHDQVDPRLLLRVAPSLDQPVALAAASVDRADAGRHLLAGRAAPRAYGVASRRQLEPDLDPRPRAERACVRSSPSSRCRASHTGRATPCSSPTSPRTASSSRLTQGVPSGSAPDSPASRSVARSTDTVVCCRASRTIGRPALRARLLAFRTVAGSRSSRGRVTGRHERSSRVDRRPRPETTVRTQVGQRRRRRARGPAGPCAVQLHSTSQTA